MNRYKYVLISLIKFKGDDEKRLLYYKNVELSLFKKKKELEEKTKKDANKADAVDAKNHTSKDDTPVVSPP